MRDTLNGNEQGFVHRLVRWLTPPTNREELLGDLAERHLPSARYLGEALRALPFVVLSRIRRTTNLAGALIIGAFLWFAMFWGNQQPHPLAGLVPTLVTLVVYALRDAYREPGDFARWSRACVVDAGWVALAILASQGLLWLVAPAMALTPMTLKAGVPTGLVILCLVRMQFPSGFHRSPSALRARELTLVELRGEVNAFESVVRRAIRVEMMACLVVAAGLVALQWMPAALFGRLGNALTLAGLLFVMWFLWRHVALRPVPAGAGFEETKQAYSAELARRSRLSRTYFWWYLLPIFIGPMTGVLLGAPAHPRGPQPALAALAIIAVVCAVLVAVQFGFARMGKQRIGQLAQVSERSAGSAP